jgi:choline dehydrogenase-like flavoprotein
VSATRAVGARRAALASLAELLVPRVEGRGATPQERAFFRRAASDVGLAERLESLLSSSAAALDGLVTAGFAAADAPVQLQLLHDLAAGPLRQPLRELRAVVLGTFYGGDGEALGEIGYPAPPPPPSVEDAPKTIAVEHVAGERATLTADVCVVGSGAGGAVVAAELQARDLDVLVLEAGGYRNESDFHQLEAVAAAELYLGGGVVFSEGGTIGILAGATLGGGTVVNSMVCLRPPEAIRTAWAGKGLDGLDDDRFDRHLDAVWSRLAVGTESTRPNRVNELLAATLDRLGHSWRLLPRNASSDDDPRWCGWCNSGCQRGCKQSVLKTYLQDAADAGTRVVVDCTARRVLVRDGEAVGVEAVVRHADGTTTELTVESRTVVVAAGGVESPALLLRSGLGGPAVGRNLALHPAFFVSGVHDEPLDGWSGQFQAVGTLDFVPPEQGGFVVECVGTSPAMWATSLPFVDGARHKERMLDLRNVAGWHALVHDRGTGSVELDAGSRPVVRWSLSDPSDRLAAARAHVTLARLHHAAGAREIYTFHASELCWRRGDDFEAFCAALAAASHDHVAFSAHQMSSCRLGADPSSSVADGRGQLHDTRGVWVADASGLPTAPGVNPMITIMALARRTAFAILAR